jgi:hypothetical protein
MYGTQSLQVGSYVLETFLRPGIYCNVDRRLIAFTVRNTADMKGNKPIAV